MRLGAGARFGNFATTIAVQDLANGHARLFIPTRGDPSVTWSDWDGTRLSCSAELESDSRCDDAHRLVSIYGDDSVGLLPEEPFDTFADSAEEFAVVTHFTTGAERLAVIDAGDGDRIFITCFQDGQVYVVDSRGASSVEDILTVGRGAYAIAAAPTRRRIYVTNCLEDTVVVIDAAAASPTRNRVVLKLGEPKPP